MNRIDPDENIKNQYGSLCNDRDTCLEDLKRSYIYPYHPISFSGINAVYKYYKPHLNLEDIRNALSEIESYTLHKEFHKQPRNPSYSHYPRYQFQIDLVDVQSLAPYNNGVRFLLTCIDTFTRFAFVRPLLDKTAKSVLDAFKSIIHEAKTPPKMLVFDRGTEFYNDIFKRYCEENNIKFYSPDTSIHGAFIERFNRTFRTIVYKYMTENETRRYIRKMDPATGQEILMLPKFIYTYNNRIHRMIGTTPFIAETQPESHLEISKRLAKYYEKIKPRKVKFSVGDTVRIQRLKGKFDRGFNERAKQEIFKIHAIRTNLKIPLYQLTDYSGREQIKGSFYENELVKVSGDVFRIEKVIKKRKYRGRNQLFVKWKGFNDSYNSWIDQDQVTNVFQQGDAQ